MNQSLIRPIAVETIKHVVLTLPFAITMLHILSKIATLNDSQRGFVP
jgi:hypothetical protein